MTITIELTQEQEAYITAIARQRGMDVQDIITQLIDTQLGAGIQTAPSDIDQSAYRPTSVSGDEENQRRLHGILQDLFVHSDALERQPSNSSATIAESAVADMIREKYRAQGLRV